MNIAYFITALGLGGAEVITIDIANKMVDQGNNVIIVYLNDMTDLLPRIDSRVKVEGLKMSKSLWGMITAIFKAKEILKEFEPNVVHANMFHANIFARLLRIFCSMPLLISSEHSKDIEGWHRMKLYRFTDFLSDINTNVSQEALDLFIEKKAYKAENSTVMYNGVNISNFSKDLNIFHSKEIRSVLSFCIDDFIFINVGRLTVPKNQKSLIEAFSILSQQFENVRLIIIGEGKLREELELLIQKKKLQKSVILVGAQNNVVQYYNAADCFVLSSIWEGFGIVIAEAMACELPVIVTNAGGCAEVVNNNEYVVPIDDIPALVQKMSQIYLMSEQKRKELGRNNRIIVSRFDLDLICKKWLNLYETGTKSIFLEKI